MNSAKVDGAKRAALAKVDAWGRVQSAAQDKKMAARAQGNESAAKLYLAAEIKASCRRYKHETALDILDRASRA